MKNLNYLNYFFVGFPIALCLIGFADNDFLCFGLLSTTLKGLFQVIVGIKMLQDEPNDKNLQIYIIAVIAFFATLFIISKVGLYDWINYILLSVPPILAIYLSIIIYKKQ